MTKWAYNGNKALVIQAIIKQTAFRVSRIALRCDDLGCLQNNVGKALQSIITKPFVNILMVICNAYEYLSI